MSISQKDAETIQRIVDEEIAKQIPELLGRSLVQIKEYFVNNIA